MTISTPSYPQVFVLMQWTTYENFEVWGVYWKLEDAQSPLPKVKRWKQDKFNEFRWTSCCGWYEIHQCDSFLCQQS